MKVMSPRPTQMVMFVAADARSCEALARAATRRAQQVMPKLTGEAAGGLHPVWGAGWFGIRWIHNRVWFQDQGINPFTMKSLAGKTIPMWIDDPTGKERRKNPKAKTRTMANGRIQVLLFRKAAQLGARRKVIRRNELVSVPLSYPGAPGRISHREAALPDTRAGRTPGAIAPGNVGVRWRHPGLQPRNFLAHGLTTAAVEAGYSAGDIQAA